MASGGMGGSGSDSPKDSGGVADFEKSIVGGKNQVVGAFDSQGNLLFSRDGDSDGVGKLSDTEKEQLKGSTLTHNHPGNKNLSPQDLQTAVTYNLKEIRVVTPERTISLKPPANSDEWPTSTLTVARQTRDSVANELSSQVKEGIITIPESAVRYSDESIQRLSKALNLQYSETKNKP